MLQNKHNLMYTHAWFYQDANGEFSSSCRNFE